MTNPTANPLGAGGDVTKAAVKIRAILDRPEPSGQPAENSAPEKANTESKSRDERGNFAKSEPETETEEVTQADSSQKQEAAAPEKKSAPSDDHEELADDVEGLAKQLGMEPGDLLEHLKAKVKVNGEERKVNLKELIAGHQMEADYRQKTAAIADERRKVTAELTAYQQQREHLSSKLDPLVQNLESVVVNDDARLQQLLNDGDILEYERHKYAADQRKAQLQTAKQEQQRIEGEKQREVRVQLEQHVAENERKLIEAKPEWGKDIEKGRKELQAIRDYLKGEGVPGDVADKLYEAVPLLMADKAMKWDFLQKNKPGKLQEVKTVPKFQKPGVVKAAPEDPKKKVLSASLNRLRKSGDWKDAAKAIKAMGIASR